MKFKIIELQQKGNNLHVAIQHEKCERQVYSFPIGYYDNDKYIEEIKKLLNNMYVENAAKKNINNEIINKEFES